MTHPGSPAARLVPLAAIAVGAGPSDFGMSSNFEGHPMASITATSWIVAMVNRQPPEVGVLDFETAFMALSRADQASVGPAGQLVLAGPATRIVLVAVGRP